MSPSPQPTPTAPAAAPVVLAIDNDPIALTLISRALARDGFRVETAATGADGLRLARERRPAAIILDVQMPEMDGWAVLAALKADPELAAIPVVMATMVDEKARGLGLGAAEYLLKPIDRPRLLALLTSLTAAKPAAPADPPAAPAPAAAAPCVLVVEDDDACRQVLVRTLAKDGWEVREARTGREALAAAAAAVPDIILLDLGLPELDGFGFLREFRQLPGCDRAAVITVSARDLSRDERARLAPLVLKNYQKGSYTRAELLGEIRTRVRRPDAPAAVG